ncbi:MAG: NADH-quinone oxidoreductase subunit NuoE [Verrucomicrobiota bacterium]
MADAVEILDFEQLDEKQQNQKIDELIAANQDTDGALMPILQSIQHTFGYLPEPAIKRVAAALDKTYSEVAGVVSFYSFFSTTPRGKHTIQVCLGTACYVRGGKSILEAIQEYLGIEVGETTEDRMFTLEVARCFGACGLAPAITIDDNVHHRVKSVNIPEILDKYRNMSS